MKIIFYLLRKEFRQIFRNKSMLPIIFIMPFVQLLILSNAATFEVKNIQLHIVDMDQSSYSRELISKFNASDHFSIVNTSHSDKIAKDEMQRLSTDVILEIPNDFERDLINEKRANVLLGINAIDGATAGVENVYAMSIIREFNESVQVKHINPVGYRKPLIFNITQSFWYNPQLDYKAHMVPGILVLLVTMVTIFLSGMNIVREKEIGTLEQINVTPIKKHHFIIGKLLPFWIIGLLELALGLTLGKLIFDTPMLGSLWIIFMFASIYLILVLGMGFFISNFTDTQQQAMFLSWFFMVIFILLSGLMTPIESMPHWAKVITQFNPIRYFVEVMRMVMLKGAGLNDIIPQMIKLSLYAIAMNVIAVLSYRKVN